MITTDDRPIRKLASSMLLQAVEDIQNNGPAPQVSRHKTDAILYLRGGSKHGCIDAIHNPLSASRCCEILGIDYDAMLSKLGLQAA